MIRQNDLTKPTRIRDFVQRPGVHVCCLFISDPSFWAVLYPVIYIVSASFSDPNAVTAGKVWLYPVNFSLRGYQVTFQNPQIVTGYLNSLFYTVVGTFISVVLTVFVAYPLSRRDFLTVQIS